jgi:hypothetical protein
MLKNSGPKKLANVPKITVRFFNFIYFVLFFLHGEVLVILVMHYGSYKRALDNRIDTVPTHLTKNLRLEI